MIEIDYDKLADAIVQKLRVLPPADKLFGLQTNAQIIWA
jgi:hypothetical protein